MAALHAERINEGFLPTLGNRFLTRLYARMVQTPGTFARVAVVDQQVVGFVAGTENTRALYRAFIVRDGIIAGILALPQILRSLGRVLETLRYPAKASQQAFPAAEILTVAVDASYSGQGIGRQLVNAAVQEFDQRAVGAVKVVAAAHNRAAEALYKGAGFTECYEVTVHQGGVSRVYIRRPTL